MAFRKPGFFQDIMEKIVSEPLRATFTVGTSIVILTAIIRQIAQVYPEIDYLLYLVPFIPPFFVTRTAKRINQRRAEHDFIKDAEPYVFVVFPKSLSKESLLKTKPDMISDSTTRHFNCPIDEILNKEALPAFLFKDPKDRETIVEKLIESYKENNGYGVLHNYLVEMKPVDRVKSVFYLLNSVLRKKKDRLKWQATLLAFDPSTDWFPNKSEKNGPN